MVDVLKRELGSKEQGFYASKKRSMTFLDDFNEWYDDMMNVAIAVCTKTQAYTVPTIVVTSMVIVFLGDVTTQLVVRKS